ncbi:hypothetical protein EV361DRAFT_953056 [Lentinula raphanica]|nr:hypothetical protein EV361DRAFT_953056 [Lentinula raphanica]
MSVRGLGRGLDQNRIGVGGINIEFWTALELYNNLLPKGNEFSLFTSDIAKINLMTQSVTNIKDGLVNTFGHLTNSTKIKPSVLCRGRYGLRALFYRQIECVLDWYDTSRKDYVLAERIVMHFTKLSAWSQMSPANSPPPHHHQTQSPPCLRTSQPPPSCPPALPRSHSSIHPPTASSHLPSSAAAGDSPSITAVYKFVDNVFKLG